MCNKRSRIAGADFVTGSKKNRKLNVSTTVGASASAAGGFFVSNFITYYVKTYQVENGGKFDKNYSALVKGILSILTALGGVYYGGENVLYIIASALGMSTSAVIDLVVANTTPEQREKWVGLSGSTYSQRRRRRSTSRARSNRSNGSMMGSQKVASPIG